MDYIEAIKFLESLPSPKEWDLAVPKRLAELSGALPISATTIHITGTNGKGSVASFVSSILLSAGHSVGTYTSPHLLNYHERIRINGTDVSDDEFSEAVSSIIPFMAQMEDEGKTPSQFEALTIAALLIFKKHNVSFLVLEVGMGGRLDATNIIDAKIAIITNVEKEHTESLGKTVSKIAFEKSGIIKQGALVVTAASGSALNEITKRCDEKNAKLFALGKNIVAKERSVSEEKTVFDYEGVNLKCENLELSLLGRHQIANASCAIGAIECLRSLGTDVSDSAMRKGLLNAKWPGRLEVVSKKPILLLDGAHNPSGMEALKTALKEIFISKNRNLILVLGILSDKEYGIMLNTISPLASKIILTKPETERAANPELLASFLPNKNVEIIENVGNAIERALALASEDGIICVSGSLYTVADAKRHLQGI